MAISLATVADAAVKITGDTSPLEKTISGLGGKLGSVLGGIGPGMALGIAGVGTAVVGLFANAANEAIKLNGIMANFRSETGATAAETAQATQSVNDLFRVNTQGYQEIADTEAKLRTDIGLTQDQVASAAQSFLDYARVTGQQGPDAVKAFDDILDSFKLKASDAQGIMDKLVLSHQRYGGSIEENQAALAKMAPALQAMGMGVDDGIGLLNLFATTGIDASAATRALQTAVKNLQPGQNLNDLIAKIGAIQDPTARAQEAISIFGAKAGVALANAIQPGMTSLDQWKVSAEEAAGATKTASDEMESSWGERLSLAIKNVMGLLTDLAGKVLTALFDGLDAIQPALNIVWDLLGKLGGILGNIVSVVGPPVMTFLGLLGQGFRILWDVLSGVVGVIVDGLRPTIDGLGQAFNGIVTIVKTVADQISGVWDTVVHALGQGVNFVLGIVRAVVDAISKIPGPTQDAMGKVRDSLDATMATIDSWGTHTQEAADTASASTFVLADHMGGIATSAAAAAPPVDTLATSTETLGTKAKISGGSLADMVHQLGELHKELTGGERVMTGFVQKNDAVGTSSVDAQGHLIHLGGAVKGVAQAFDQSGHGIGSSTSAATGAVDTGTKAMTRDLKALGGTAATIPGQFQGMEGGVRSALAQMMSDVKDQMDQLHWAIKNPDAWKTDKRQLAKDMKEAQTALANAIRDGKPEVIAQAQATIDAIRAAQAGLPQSGTKIGSAWAANLATALRDGEVSINQAADAATKGIRAYSPPKTGPLREIHHWGRKIGETWRESFVDAIGGTGDRVNAQLRRIGLRPDVAVRTGMIHRVEVHLTGAPGVLPSGVSAQQVAGLVSDSLDVTPILPMLRAAGRIGG